MSDDDCDVLIVGAGPAGLAAAIAIKREGLSALILDKGGLVDGIYRFPRNMVFFTTPELLEIGGLPFVTPFEKPTRMEALRYYRRVADTFGLPIAFDEAVVGVRREAGAAGLSFVLEVKTRSWGARARRARAVVIATGYYDQPNLLGVPGEDLPHVSHYFLEGHRHWHQDVIVVGAGNSAVDAALECWRAGARVTLVHIAEGFDRTVKPWVLPDITNRVKEGSIGAHWNSRIVAIHPDRVEVEQIESGKRTTIAADQVLAMTGYYASTDLISSLGVSVDPATGVPAHDPETMMSPVTGCYIAGVMAAGRDANRLFIENTRQHGEVIVGDIGRRRS